MPEIRRVHVDEIASLEHFYANASAPLVVEGVDAGGSGLDLDDIASGEAGPHLRVWDWEANAYRDEPVAEVVAAVRRGDSEANVVDHPIGDTPLVDRIKVPFFLDSNWFYGRDGYDAYSRQLLVTAAGAYTPPHVDGCFQGWMQLVAGAKTWRMWSPEDRPLQFDWAFRRFYDPAPERMEAYTAEQRPGDLMVWPAGWVHEVRTAEPSLGIGGSIVNEFQIEAHVDWWLIERALGMQGRVDLAQWIRDRLAQKSPCGAALERALVRCDEWERSVGQPERRSR